MLSKNFSRHEFACKCGCGYDTVDAELLDILQNIRDHFKRSVTINSACRCDKHNKAIGGSPNSQHLIGRAADIVVYGVSPRLVQGYLLVTFPEKYGIGRYETFTHIDTRVEKARW